LLEIFAYLQNQANVLFFCFSYILTPHVNDRSSYVELGLISSGPTLGDFMPKMKTNKTASKKFRVSRKGRVKRAQAFTSHNTAKKSPKRLRRLRAILTVDETNTKAVKRMLPYG
jgi:large subunit ribosomal protein L35